MDTTKAVLVRLVLSKLYDHLHQHYSISEPKKQFLETHPAQSDIDAVLAFKSDIQLEEFAGALERIERGDFGRCQRCERDIPIEVLRQTPCRRFCNSCETLLKRASLKRPLERSSVHSE